MPEQNQNQHEPIPRWRARAVFTLGQGRDAAYGFGGRDVAEAIGTPEELAAELTRFRDDLGRPAVTAACSDPGHFSLRLEIEPHEGLGTRAGRPAAEPAEERVPLWEVSAAVGNRRGVFDACCRYGNSQGDEGHRLGTAQALGAERARALQELTRTEVETMKYATTRFYIELIITLPEQE